MAAAAVSSLAPLFLRLCTWWLRDYRSRFFNFSLVYYFRRIILCGAVSLRQMIRKTWAEERSLPSLRLYNWRHCQLKNERITVWFSVHPARFDKSCNLYIIMWWICLWLVPRSEYSIWAQISAEKITQFPFRSETAPQFATGRKTTSQRPRRPSSIICNLQNSVAANIMGNPASESNDWIRVRLLLLLLLLTRWSWSG